MYLCRCMNTRCLHSWGGLDLQLDYSQHQPGCRLIDAILQVLWASPESKKHLHAFAPMKPWVWAGQIYFREANSILRTLCLAAPSSRGWKQMPIVMGKIIRSRWKHICNDPLTKLMFNLQYEYSPLQILTCCSQMLIMVCHSCICCVKYMFFWARPGANLCLGILETTSLIIL